MLYKSLQTILKLKEENVLLKRAINCACVALHTQKFPFVLEFGIPEVSDLFSQIKTLLSEKQQPADYRDNSNNSI